MASLVCFVFLFGCRFGRATAILEFRTPTQIVIAADSLHGNIDNNGDVASTTSVCKIYFEGHGVYMAASGPTFRGGKSNTVSLSFDSISLSGKGTLRDQVFASIATFHDRTIDAWGMVRRDNPKFFYSAVAEKAIQLIFGWVDGGVPFAIGYSLIPYKDGTISEPAWRLYFPSPDFPGDTLFACMFGGAASKMMQKELEAVNSGEIPLPKNLPEFARSLIQLEIDADKTHRVVGPPIDVLVISARGAHWYRRSAKSKCQEIRSGK